MFTARRALFAAVFSAPLAAPAIARAQRAGSTIRLIVPAPPGGSTDILARALAEDVGRALDLRFVIDNRGGAGGIIGTRAAAEAPADGTTLILGHNQTHASNQWLARNLPYHVINSFAPIARLASVHHATVVPAGHAARDMAGLAAMGKNGGRLAYASSQAGSASHVLGETFSRREGLNSTHVPYRGAAPAAQDTVAGLVDFYVSTWPSVMALVRDGRLRALSIGGPARMADFPDVPTTAEAGVPYMAVDAWFGMFAPHGTPEEMVKRYSDAFVAAMQSQENIRRVQGFGFNPATLGATEFAAFQRQDVERWHEMATLTGITLEG
ncbi:tripartite tricarboxylate transporter substrate binding protein [Rhodovarius crocodyli]|uniref:Tripartite tricarboxylate transporter substrate binding protein n=1 Tax=Rhodovarius crocodyli TaxID=1979269 RepID=A0A437MGC8_9PROT|nr:tripartite tricarboxylate transporter substrate binding protein [Rhodovarius crocodyli]RVT96704.1 tripartite tricarboxylate transporter substrate binding protein [Rhodovarius crocodyli]